MDDLEVAPDVVIPQRELRWRFDTSGGPGGQHANRSATRVELSFDLARSDHVDPDTKARMLRRLGRRAVDGVVSVSVDSTRSQHRNRQLARLRLAEILAEAARRPRPRKRTRVPRAAEQRRRKAKQRRSETKRLRRRPNLD
jgi:ribosome-associated protein